MSVDEQTRVEVDAFREYVEDSVASDDRYGPARRSDSQDGSAFATYFEAGPSCWFEVVVYPFIPRIRVGFLTNDSALNEELEQVIQDSGSSMEAFVGLGFVEAGLDCKEPTVEHYLESDGSYVFTTPLPIDEPGDLELPEIRNKTLRMLEGYLIAFGPALVIEEEE